MPSRRSLLIAGGASLLVAGAGTASVLMRDAPEAGAPWRAAGQAFGDPRLDALAWAILAPNPHNRQPWWVQLEGEDGLALYCEPGRRLPQTDPLDRQITIGLGAFLALLELAANADGYALDIIPFPDGEPFPRLDERPIARVRFHRDTGVAGDPLFAAVPHRRTCRLPFRPDPVSAETLAALTELARPPGGVVLGGTTGTGAIAELKPLLREAWQIEVATRRTHDESLALTRIGAREVVANPDGISLYGPMMEAWRTLGLLSHDQLARPDSIAAREEIAFYTAAIDTARGFAWLITPGNSRLDQIQTGAAWLRTHLAATALGVAFHPLSQALQEFAEMDAVHARLHARLGVAGPARIQGLFRLGYVDSLPRPAPRWPMETRLIPL